MDPLFSRLHNALSDTSYLVFADARVCTHPGCHIAAFSACEAFTRDVFSAASNSLCLQCLGCPRTLDTTCPFFSVWCLSVHWIFILYLSAASSLYFAVTGVLVHSGHQRPDFYACCLSVHWIFSHVYFCSFVPFDLQPLRCSITLDTARLHSFAQFECTMGIHSECFCGIEPLACGSMLDFLVKTFTIALFLFHGLWLRARCPKRSCPCA